MENIYFQNKTKTDDIHVYLSLIVSIYQGIHACRFFFISEEEKEINLFCPTSRLHAQMLLELKRWPSATFMNE